MEPHDAPLPDGRTLMQHGDFAPATSSPLSLWRLSVSDVTGDPVATHARPSAHGLHARQSATADGRVRGTDRDTRPTERYSPGVCTQGHPAGGRPLLRYTMGYRDDCELCRQRSKST